MWQTGASHKFKPISRHKLEQNISMGQDKVQDRRARAKKNKNTRIGPRALACPATHVNTGCARVDSGNRTRPVHGLPKCVHVEAGSKHITWDMPAGSRAHSPPAVRASQSHNVLSALKNVHTCTWQGNSTLHWRAYANFSSSLIEKRSISEAHGPARAVGAGGEAHD